MTTETEPAKYAVLFVDDEDKARKYFARAFAGDMPVLTAANVNEANALLDERGDEVAVLVTDQRMPGQPGVELLRQVRESRPDIVRLLTTAYSDLGDAIDAVNRGEVFRYITKPWDIPSLRAELNHAMEFFHLRRERDLLLREKLNVWQRMVQANRIRDLVVMAGSFGHLRHAVPAMAAYLQYNVDPRATELTDWRRLDLWGLARGEVERMLDIAGTILEHTRGHGAGAFPDEVRVAELATATADHGIDVETSGAPAHLRGDAELLKQLFEMLGRRLAAGSAGVEFRCRAAESGDGAHFTATLAPGNDPLDPGLAADQDAASRRAHAEMLCVYLIAFHHGGRVTQDRAASSALRLNVWLPADPTTTPAPELDSHWLEDVLAQLEPDD